MPNTSHGSLELASVCFLNNALICLSTVFQLCKHGRLCNMSNRTRDRYLSLYSCLLLYSLFWIPIYWKSAFKILSDDLKIYNCTFKLEMNINLKLWRIKDVFCMPEHVSCSYQFLVAYRSLTTKPHCI